MGKIIFGLLIGYLCFLAACSDSEEHLPDTLVVTIENLNGATACAPGEAIRLRAKTNTLQATLFTWSVEGEEVASDSVYTFSASEEGKYLVRLQAATAEGRATDTLTLYVSESNVFGINHVKHWTGTGDQRAVLAIQWVKSDNIEQPADEEVLFLAWGYRWPTGSSATSADMLKAIVKQDPRLFVILAEQWDGVLVKGWGYDGNQDGKICIKNSSLTLTEADFKEGIYWQKMEDEVDGLQPENAADYWMGGWKIAYASFWLGNGSVIPETGEFDYSNYAPHLRRLQDKDWDVWTLSTINEAERNVLPIVRLVRAAPL